MGMKFVIDLVRIDATDHIQCSAFLCRAIHETLQDILIARQTLGIPFS